MKNLFTLKKYFIRYKKKLILGALFVILSNAGMIYIPLIIKDAINALTVKVSIPQLIHFSILIVLAS
ncbi:MAG: ABC transporter ATP-binding protein, partial [Ignavibacteriaceae bacterium]